jgi:hypothetical protein
MVGQSVDELVASLDVTQRSAIGEVWQSYRLEEHASVASFARFVLQLMQLGAPPDLLERAIQAMDDEVRHARLCFGIANKLLDASRQPGPFVANICEAFASDPGDILNQTIRDACVAETLAVEYAREALAQARVAPIAAALTEIVADEDRHATLAWDFVVWLVSARPQLLVVARASFTEVFRSMGEPDAKLKGVEEDESVPAGFGIISRREELAIRRAFVEQVLKPRAVQLCGEVTQW